MFSLNNVSTQNAYPTAGSNASLICRGAVKLNVQISNAAVFMESTFREPFGSGTSVGSDVFLQPGFYSFTRPIDLVRFKSAASGVPAQVTVEALLQSEV